VEYINAGAASYGSQRLAIIAQELMHYRPDLAFIYIGHNEFEEVEQFQFSVPPLVPALRTFRKSALVRVGTSVLLSARIKSLEKEQAERLSSHRPDFARAWTARYKPEEVEQRMRQFESNLDFIVGLFVSKGIPVFLGTVPSNLMHPVLPYEEAVQYEEVRRLATRGHWMEARSLGRELLRKSGGRHQSSDLENSIIRRIAGRYRIPLVDVEEAISRAEPHHLPGETLFRDHCHLNETGNNILLAELQKRVLETYHWSGASEATITAGSQSFQKHPSSVLRW
jgi:hypothetical protein